jgi:hypothetical protein
VSTWCQQRVNHPGQLRPRQPLGIRKELIKLAKEEK